MCGIVGSIGFVDSGEKMVEGLTRLEYRGYDSAGIYLKERQQYYRSVGSLDNLKNYYHQN